MDMAAVVETNWQRCDQAAAVCLARASFFIAVLRRYQK
jgi:hypothetical protein